MEASNLRVLLGCCDRDGLQEGELTRQENSFKKIIVSGYSKEIAQLLNERDIGLFYLESQLRSGEGYDYKDLTSFIIPLILGLKKKIPTIFNPRGKNIDKIFKGVKANSKIKEIHITQKYLEENFIRNGLLYIEEDCSLMAADSIIKYLKI